MTKLIALLYIMIYAIYWLGALRFPTKFIYFLPVVLIMVNSINLAFNVDSIKQDIGNLWPEDIYKVIVFTFIV